MKNYLILLILFFSTDMTLAHAELYSVVGKIDILRTHDGMVFPNNDWITVTGFKEAGLCRKFNRGVVIMINTESSPDSGERMYANVLLAKASDALVRVNVDDTLTDSSGFCYLRWMNME